MRARTDKPFVSVRSDSDATYEKIYDVGMSVLKPQVACPHTLNKVKPMSQVKGIKIDQAFLGTSSSYTYKNKVKISYKGSLRYET